ncbi:uncharacterized protein LOC129804725 [Phlebotomus papatasi]|uniref:uncharacterized protein LOC129804725 n=1 Tax=Phlebotomus papatasi TaxID=29031 RepID=UPI0024839A7B|nr:uncharacterized protein LOC129804725 [Phlebotomus papatasi]
MKFYGIILLVGILCAFDCANAKAQGPDQRVYHGDYNAVNDVDRKTYPALVVVTDGASVLSNCTSNIISLNYVLTHLSCLDFEETATLVRTVSSIGFTGQYHETTILNVVQISDCIALGELANPFPATAGEFTPVALPPADLALDEDCGVVDFTLAGYRDADSNDDATVSSTVAFLGDFRKICRSSCRPFYSVLSPTDVFCAQGQGDYAACGADLGAGLVYQDTSVTPAQDKIYGILSENLGCGNNIAVYCFVPRYVEAIEGVIGA